MGQYLALGISTKLSISKVEAEKGKISFEEILQKMESDFHFAPNIYNLLHDEFSWSWTLKKEIWESELLNFLTTIYPALITNKKYSDYEVVLKTLSETDTKSWFKLAEDKFFVAFQMDQYGEVERLYFDERPFQPKISVAIDSIALAMEGKITMEVYGGFLTFFKFCIQKAFSDFQLSKALRVYITG